jgi:anti-sigma factor RsiW
MKCASARELIESYLDDELDPNLRAEIQDHLTSCSSCSETHARLLELQKDIRAQAPYYDAPASLEPRIRNALAQAAKSEIPIRGATGRSPAWRWIAVAASVLLAVSLALNLRLFRSAHGDRDSIAQNLVSSHVRSLIGTHLLDVPSSDHHTVKPWFNGKLDFAPDVKDLAGQGFPLIGGRIDYMANQPVAALIYKRRQHVINLFVWPSASSVNSAEELSEKGYNLVHWDKAGMSYWAVSDLSLSDLLQFRTLYKE